MSENCPEVEDCPVNSLIKHIKSYRADDNTLYRVYIVKICDYDINSVYVVISDDGETTEACFTSLDLDEALQFVKSKVGAKNFLH